MKNKLPNLNQRHLRWLLLSASTATLLAVIASYLHYATNVPYQDDYQTSLEFLVNYDQASSVRERGELLLRRHSTHLTAVANLANIIDWKLFGAVNLRHLVMLAMGFLLAMTVLLQKYCQGQDKYLGAATVALLCINCLTYSAGLWPITSLQNYPVLFFVAAAMMLLAQPGYLRPGLALLLVTLATFASGNGMFGFVAGGVLLLFTRRYPLFAAWSLWGIATVIVFFYFFNTHDGYTLATGLKQGPVALIAYYLAFLGSVVQVLPFYGEQLAPLAGAMLLTACLWLLKKKYPQQNPVVAALILFMLLTAGVVTLARYGINYSGPLASRYAINSCVLLALLYIAYTELYGARLQRWHAIAICLIALLFNVLAMARSLPAMQERHQRLLNGARVYVQEGEVVQLATKIPERARLALEEAARRNIYHMASGLGLEAPYKVPPTKILAVTRTLPPQ